MSRERMMGTARLVLGYAGRVMRRSLLLVLACAGACVALEPGDATPPTTVESFCATCVGDQGEGESACVTELTASRIFAEEAGCGSEFQALLECADSDGKCNGIEQSFAQLCEATHGALSACVASGAATTCRELCDKVASVEEEQSCAPSDEVACRQGCESYYDTVPECAAEFDAYQQCSITSVSAANCACDPSDHTLSCGAVTGCDAEEAAVAACVCAIHPENTGC